MKAQLFAGHLAVALLSLSPVVSALSWPRWLPELDTLVVRQDESSSASPSSSATGDEENKETQTTSESSQDPFEPITTNLNTGGITRSGSATGTVRQTGNSTRTSAPKKTTFNPQDPAGGIVMITPAATAGTQLYKIGDYVTWGWNYTNLQADPTAIDIYVKCSLVPQPWTLTQNMSFASPGSYTWDTGAFRSAHAGDQLPVDQYTLVIADADGGISATPEAGYLAPYAGFYFGMYTGQPYVNSDEGWQCASCSGAAGSGLDRQALGVAVIMSAVTVLSFTWFVAGVGAFV
ncbi:hypothetical protein N657DRAFT_634103 [Parathielavia appendiculata]|uniref:DUF7137 domain-containing protein n=1 Tax=Parathielavia appendiculata TaxID=2587402 RepID=A0AAN6U030_9PEZI|nr:hypothetical protein N657DRAFT_634103 [Parathielavia appendiculata]